MFVADPNKHDILNLTENLLKARDWNLTPANAMRGSRSSLTNHTFPPFYACYLLKSRKTPAATATYIGSTPNPPRRLRQHNGELSAGAGKTHAGRPWEMVLLVHGFPSRVAALQFEWAWQHPGRTRHLRTAAGRALFGSGRGRALATLRARVGVVRTMLACHPYSNWPLHVTLFDAHAVKAWEDAGRGNTPLPIGFTSAIELEGVDGKKADVHVGSGRRRPIDVSDGRFQPILCIWSYPHLDSLQTHSHLRTLPPLAHCFLVLLQPCAQYAKHPSISEQRYVHLPLQIGAFV